jgi:hypothetical protein
LENRQITGGIIFVAVGVCLAKIKKIQYKIYKNLINKILDIVSKM